MSRRTEAFHGATGRIIAMLVAPLAGCAAFSTVRSADVQPGPTAHVQASLASPPGDEAAWFWSFDCPSDCDHPIAAADLVAQYGWKPLGGPAVAIGLGLNGTYPYAEGYVQLARGPLPAGVGARVGLPVATWNEHQVYGRFDVPLGPGARLLLNPGVFYHGGESPNGENDGSFLGLVQGIGIAFGRGRVTVTPAVALVVGRAERTSDGDRLGPVTRAFGTASIGITMRPRWGPLE